MCDGVMVCDGEGVLSGCDKEVGCGRFQREA